MPMQDRLLDHDEQAADVDVLPLGSFFVARVRAPQIADAAILEDADHVDAALVVLRLLDAVDVLAEAGDAHDQLVRRGLVHAALGVDAGEHAGHVARGRDEQLVASRP
jgi:hypothetical protein